MLVVLAPLQQKLGHFRYLSHIAAYPDDIGSVIYGHLQYIRVNRKTLFIVTLLI